LCSTVKYSAETQQEWARINEQDAALFLAAAFTGLRLGELLALHWADVAIQRSISAVKDMMGHSTLTTTERYLHSKPRPDDVAKLTKTFD